MTQAMRVMLLHGITRAYSILRKISGYYMALQEHYRTLQSYYTTLHGAYRALQKSCSI